MSPIRPPSPVPHTFVDTGGIRFVRYGWRRDAGLRRSQHVHRKRAEGSLRCRPRCDR